MTREDASGRDRLGLQEILGGGGEGEDDRQYQNPGVQRGRALTMEIPSICCSHWGLTYGCPSVQGCWRGQRSRDVGQPLPRGQFLPTSPFSSSWVLLSERLHQASC